MKSNDLYNIHKYISSVVVFTPKYTKNEMNKKEKKMSLGIYLRMNKKKTMGRGVEKN